MPKRKPTIQQVLKYYKKSCFFCTETDYDLLDAHRIFEGSQGGTYHWNNIICCCCKCHRKIHSGKIKILGNHRSMKGWTLHYIDENGQECWKQH